MEGQNCVVYSPYLSVPTPEISIRVIPPPRKVSQKERRKKARYRRSNGINRWWK